MSKKASKDEENIPDVSLPAIHLNGSTVNKHPLEGIDDEDDLGNPKKVLSGLLQEVKQDPGLDQQMYDMGSNINVKTRLNGTQISQFGIGSVAAMIHDLPEMELLIKEFKELVVSHGGKGREEAVQMIQGKNLVAFTDDFANRTKG